MAWTIEYFEQEDTTQPAEIFEDMLDETYPKLSSKLAVIAAEVKFSGYRSGGGYLEKCRNYDGLWEIRAIQGGLLAREFLGFDKNRIILLHGYIKRTGQPASEQDLRKAFAYWTEYLRTRHVSPLKE